MLERVDWGGGHAPLRAEGRKKHAEALFLGKERKSGDPWVRERREARFGWRELGLWAINQSREREGGSSTGDAFVRTAPFSKSSVASASKVIIPERFMGGGFDPSTMCSAPSQLYTSG